MEKITEEQKLSKKQKPFLIRLFFYLILAAIFFLLGYSLFYAVKFRDFVSSGTGQKIQNQTVATMPDQTNILLLGSDNDQKFTGNPLTQTMMIVHIDFAKKEIDMFSIPRDLWVKMPGKDLYGKIDQASEFKGIPSAVDVVEQTFGIHIDNYAWVGLLGFIKSIDTLGGVNLDVLHPVLDNQYPTDINSSNLYGYQRLDIQAGMQHMSGEEALKYVRSRHEDLLGDFGRTERQRQLLLTLKNTLFQSKTSLLNIPQIFDDLKGQIKTDVSPLDVVEVGTFYFENQKSIKIKQFTLSPPTYSTDGNSTDGQSIVIGDATNSAKLVESIFGKKAGETTLSSLSSVKEIQQ